MFNLSLCIIRLDTRILLFKMYYIGPHQIFFYYKKQLLNHSKYDSEIFKCIYSFLSNIIFRFVKLNLNKDSQNGLLRI